MPTRPRRPLWTVALLLASAAPLSAWAQAGGAGAPAVESVRAVRAGAEGERAGATVAVAGRVTAGSGLVAPDEVFVQDATGGLRLALAPGSAPVATGDSVRAVGRLQVRHGTTELADARVETVGPPARAAAPPRPVPVRELARGGRRLDFEAREGEVVELEGRAVQIDQADGAHRLVVLSGVDLVSAVVPDHRTELAGFAGVDAGDYVRVRGVLVQDGPAADGRGAYRVYPLAASDVQRRGLSPAEYTWGAVAVGGLLVVALLWAVALRTQVRRRTAALRASEARYGHLFEAAADPVLVLDTGRGGEVTAANQAAQRAFGLAADGARTDGREVRLADLALDEQEARFHLADADKNGSVSGVLELRGPGGAAVPFEIATRRLRDGSAFVSVARDVEERRAYEHGLLRAIQAAEEAREQAEKTAQLRASILANMSHEIRTPLTAIIGFADILRDEVPEDLWEYADTVHAGGERLLNTLNDVLDLARLDAERAPVAPEAVDVVPVVEGAVRLLAPLAQRKGLGLHVQSDVRALPAHHSRTALERIVTNLVGNAVKFTDHGEVRVSLHAAEGYVVVRVRDTGVGISDAFLPDLYEAFKQESDGHTRSHEGTGLGLAITKRLVDVMGGEIRVWSRKDEGTLFEVVLPERAPDPAAPPPAPSAAPAAPFSDAGGAAAPDSDSAPPRPPTVERAENDPALS
ncbi:PAS domain-containing sensor histidine kinase [Rubrivirga litoralis]|uniref:histidine kinase n=1 Tax=Rubrivirga litoralis TaxID=3075598 RepID=A0ABU3BQD2_9BACT|nr:PAS domain-containing sensor histidine kinase [Rubrivirga sp. F394]MDT0631479.1 PAS domain-containing sensor histidine kinase [Rubrivirga sp. F394]